MTEKPILFKDPMVRAILDNKQTQTRRINFKCQVGDLLWVRETWCRPFCDLRNTSLRGKLRVIEYRADVTRERFLVGGNIRPSERDFRWHPSIFMPKRLARLWLEVTAVRRERLQDITDDDARAEGVEPENAEVNCPGGAYVNGFCDLWDSINAKRGDGWDRNPMVDVITFKRSANGRNRRS